MYKLKLLFVLVALSGSLYSFCQCSDCKTLSEALSDPAMVKKLKHNGPQSGLMLDSLPASIGLLQNVEILYLSDHNIKSIPKEIGSLKKLKELSFAGCRLTSLPEEIFQLTNLKELILFSNLFSEAYAQELKEKFKKRLPHTKVMMD
ncbi:leucine-rich repeat domain-containing protein [Paraflavitalea pollutisoli]|uniref:leucine-rich repeat domain-containing protein n=1 Tax=Paraflavitalea pollutisoli TaxID=3034143 RepID=UPI0023EA9838|nr:hypothetical protein [Paraflavitalea sp. H1-2-19X]